MKQIFVIAFSVCAFSASAQIRWTAGIPYTGSTPSHTPSGAGSLWAIDTVNLDLYAYYSGAWNLAGERIQTISGCTSPAYTPGKGQSLFVVNGCDSIYYYRSGAWRHINPAGGSGGVTDGDKGDITVSASGATWTIDNGAVTLAKMASASVDSTKIADGALGVSDLNQSGAETGQVLKWNGSNWRPGTDETASGSGTTDLTFTGSASPFTLNSSTGTDVTFASGTGITLSRSTNQLTITNASPDQTVAITGAGINAVTGTYPNFTITGTEVDGSVTNEGSLSVAAGTSTTSVINSNTSGSTGVTLSAGSNITLSENTGTGTITIAATDKNGIYGGDGDIPVGTEATVALNSTFELDYSTGANAIEVRDQEGQIIISNKTSTDTIRVGTSNILLRTLGQVQISGGTNAGAIRIMEPFGNGSNYTQIQSAAQSANITYTLPTTDGTNGQVLQYTTGGNLQWVTPAAAVTDGDKGDITVSASGATWTIDNGAVTLAKMASASVDSTKIADGALGVSDLNQSGAETGQVLKWNGSNWRPGTDETASGSGTTDLTFTGSASPFTLNSSTGTDVTFASGTGITLSRSTNQLTITNASPDQTVAITGAGINAVTGTYPNFTITGTEVDGSVTNEGRLGVGAGSGTTATITTNTSGSNDVTIAGAGIVAITETTGTNGGTITITGTEVDGSTTNEIQNLSLSGQSLSISSGTGVTLPIVGVSAGTGISVSTTSGTATVTNSAPDQTVAITGAGINAVTGTYPNFTITGTEVDGSVTNEIQTLTIDSTIVGGVERFSVGITPSGNTVRFDVPQGTFLTDGDKGDIDVTNSGATWTIDTAAANNLKQETLYPQVINKTTSIIRKGVPVMVDTVDVIQGDNIRVRPAIGSTTQNVATIMGIATHDIAVDGTGFVTWFGYVTEVDEANIAQTGITFSVGQILYISPTERGRLTNVLPTAPNIKDPIAIVVRRPTANNLTLLVRPQLTPDIHDVNDISITSPTAGQILRYNSGGFWENGQVQTAGIAANAIDSSKIANGTILLEDLNQNGATTGQIIKWNGSQWSVANDSATSDIGRTWVSRGTLSNNTYTALTYGKGLFVGVSRLGTNRVLTSSNGITWVERSASQANSWRSVTYGKNLFVAVSNDGTNRVMTSPDGITWTNRTASQANQWWDVTYGNGIFVAVAIDGTNRVMTSTDGITWTNRTAAEANEWQGVTYGNGLFVAVARTGTNRVMTSSDGITWTARAAANTAEWEEVKWGGGIFVAVANSSSTSVGLMTSTDGITWTARTKPITTALTDIDYGSGIFVATPGAGSSQCLISSDGITWTAHSMPTTQYIAIAYGNNLFSALGTNHVATSGNYMTLAQQGADVGNVLKWDGNYWTPAIDSIGAGGGVADGDKGDITVSASGATWTIDAEAVSNAKLAFGTGGLYKGSGTIPTETNAEVTDIFSISYSNAQPAFYIQNAGGVVAIADSDNMHAVEVRVDSINVTGKRINYNIDTIDISRVPVKIGFPSGGGGATDLTFTGSDSPFTLNSSTGTDVTFASGTGITLSRSTNQLTITNASPDQTVAITGTGVTVGGTYPSFTLTAADQSATNEIQNLSLTGQSLGISSGTGVTLPIVGVSAGTGISVSTTSGTATISATDVSATNEIQTLTIDSTIVGSVERFSVGITPSGNTVRFDVPQGTFVTDGDKGDITVSASGATWTIDAGAVTLADMAANSVDSTKIVNLGVGYGDITGANATSGQALKWNGTNWHPAADNNTITGLGTVTTDRLTKFTGATTLGNSLLSESGQTMTVNATGAFQVPVGNNTTEKPAGTTGQVRYNTVNNALEYYGASAWEVPLKAASATGLETGGRVLIADANGRATSNSALRYNTTFQSLVNAEASSSDFFPGDTQAKLMLQNGTNNCQVFVEANGDPPTRRGVWTTLRSRGTSASKTLVNTNDEIGRFQFGAWDGTDYETSSFIGAIVSGTPANNNIPIDIYFVTGVQLTNRSEKMRITAGGNVGIGTTTPENRLQLAGSLGRKTPVTVAASTYTVLSDDTWIIVNNAGTCTITLPTAADWDGREIMIKTITANTVISNASNVSAITEPPATVGTAILPATDGAWATLVSDGTRWIIMQRG